MTVKIYLLQHPKIECDGQEILKEIHTKAAALIYYLAALNPKACSRDVLSEMYWPEVPAENSRANLRQTLSMIKKACAQDLGREISLISAERSGCCINGDLDVWVDVKEFDRYIDEAEKAEKNSIKTALLSKAAQLCHSGFMKDFFVKGSAAADEWILYERERVERRLTNALKELSKLYEAEGEPEKAIQALTRLLLENPLQEEVHRALMTLYSKYGERPKAIAQYRQCVSILRRELNISPMAKTRKLYEEIMAESPARAENGGRPGKEENRGPDKQYEAAENGVRRYKNHFFICGRQEALVCPQPDIECVSVCSNPFGSTAYEGVYRLMEKLVIENEDGSRQLKKNLYGLLPQYSENEERPSDIRIYYTLYLLLKEKAGKKPVAVYFKGYEDFDEKTKACIHFLLGRSECENIHLILSFNEKETAEKFFNKIPSKESWL